MIGTIIGLLLFWLWLWAWERAPSYWKGDRSGQEGPPRTKQLLFPFAQEPDEDGMVPTESAEGIRDPQEGRPLITDPTRWSNFGEYL